MFQYPDIFLNVDSIRDKVVNSRSFVLFFLLYVVLDFFFFLKIATGTFQQHFYKFCGLMVSYK